MWLPNEITQSVSNFTLDNINFLIENKIREGSYLEYKLRFNNKLKVTMSAYMNAEGGWLILGVREEEEIIKEIIGVDRTFIEEFRKTFSQFDPFVEWDFDENLKELKLENGLFLYIIKIPPTQHSVMLDGAYYVRIGAQSIKLTKENDIQNLKKRKGELDSLGREIIRYRKLPNKDYTKFIGRKNEYHEVLDEIKRHHFIISIDGIGGVGKSTLALEIVYNVYDQRLFDSVLWFSAKKEKFIFSQITSVDPEFENLEKLLELIAEELNIKNYEKFTRENKTKEILDYLRDNSILIVLDNLETIDITEEFIEFLANVSGNSKILITSRSRLGQVERIITLNPFNYQDTKEFILSETETRSYSLPKPEVNTIKTLHNLVDGIPLAIKILIGWVSSGLPLKQLGNKLKKSKSGILDFCFEETYDKQLSDDSKLVFCIVSFLPDDISYSDIESCVELDNDRLDYSIGELLKFSLITRNTKADIDIETDIFRLLPLTRIFAYKKSQDYDGLERRVIKKYNRYLHEKEQLNSDFFMLKPEKKMAGLNQSQKKAYLMAMRAMEAFENGDYTLSTKYFKKADSISNDVPEVYYYWGTLEMKMGHLRKTDELFSKATSLDSENPNYWITWSSFHKQMKNYKKAKEILYKGKKSVPDKYARILNRELGIILSYNYEFNLSLEILKQNFIQKPTKENDFILNTKTLISILLTYYFQSGYLTRARRFDFSKKNLLEAEFYYESHLDIVHRDDIGLLMRIKMIRLALARLFGKQDFEIAKKYFKEAYFPTATTSRENKHNNIYFLRDLKWFVKFWKEKGKIDEDFNGLIDIKKNFKED